MGARLSYEYVKNYIEGKEGNGCKLLSPEYVDSKTELKIQCACGEVFEKTFNHFKIGKKMCEKCTIKQRVDSRRTPYEKIKNFVNGEQGNGCELLTTLEEYNKYYKNVDKRKFWGWRTHVVNKNIKAKFISETVFSYYNNGKTPITYKYELSKSVVNKYSISASGSIKYNINGEIKKFKNNLDAEVKINVTDETVTTTKEQNDLQIIIDPFTVANLKIVGEAKITNGVAAYYVLWIRTERGGFEYFVVTTQYPRLEVLPV